MIICAVVLCSANFLSSGNIIMYLPFSCSLMSSQESKINCLVERVWQTEKTGSHRMLVRRGMSVNPTIRAHQHELRACKTYFLYFLLYDVPCTPLLVQEILRLLLCRFVWVFNLTENNITVYIFEIYGQTFHKFIWTIIQRVSNSWSTHASFYGSGLTKKDMASVLLMRPSDLWSSASLFFSYTFSIAFTRLKISVLLSRTVHYVCQPKSFFTCLCRKHAL